MSEDSLHRIAALAGLQRTYRSAQGTQTESPDHAVAAVLERLGHDVATAAGRDATLTALLSETRALVDSTVVVTADADVVVRLNGAIDGEATWRLDLEDGTSRDGRRSIRHDNGRSVVPVDPLPMGYHRLHIEAGGRIADATLIAAPDLCFLPDALAHERRGFGITAQVYGLRSATNFGIGDFTDVADLGEGAGRFGSAFLGLSPLHALFPSDRSKYSPYSPSSRLFLDPLFIDPLQLPDFASSSAARYLGEPEIAAELDRLRAANLVDHGTSWGIKRAALGKYWERFAGSADPTFAAYRAEAGEPLELHATFEALSDHFAAEGKHWLGEWPVDYRDAQGAAVTRFRENNPREIAFHAWLQWLADSQLEAAQARSIDAGMTIGLYRDLAVGVDSGGAELWARPDWFVPGVAVGAPPDLLGPQGQNWGLPPFNPRTLDEQGLQGFRTLVAANMRHAGAIRIDHAFQLQRLYVVPDGLPATEGVYLTFPFQAMLAVLRIESHRARALVIAEDLGTAPEGFSDAIMASGLLSYRILTFEREHGGAFKAPEWYPRNALAALATHDLPTFAGWWRGLDTNLRESFDVFTPDQAAREREERVGDLVSFARALETAGVQKSSAVPVEPPFEEAFRFVAKTRSMLMALQLEDVLEDINQANLPGPDLGHPNWRRKLGRTVDGILAPGGPLARASAIVLDEGRSLATLAPRVSRPPPSATYRLQFHKDFTFAHAIEALPYIKALGVSHIYASPILKARPGSTHGYDTVDPTQINPELGGLDGFERFAAAIKAHGMELLLDIVPNHMGVGGADNPWWLSVLEWGELSPLADTFDIDWERLGAHGKLVAPFLGGQYGDMLEKGELKLSFDRDDGSFSVNHYEHRFPICPLTYADILDRAVAVDMSDGSDGVDGLLRVAEDLRALAQEPAHHRSDVVAAGERYKRRLALLARNANVLQTIEQAVSVINGAPGLSESFGALHRLLERQAYRLAYWRVAASDVNYRRFFDIDGLAGVRIEQPAVFQRTHALIFDLVRRGLIQGLRIDHIDGLADPKAYAAALQRAIGPNFYVVAEKILEPGESLRPWALSGTTGYEMLNFLDGVFVESDNEKSFDRIYRETTGFSQTYEDALLSAKRQVLLESFSSELESLVSDMKRIADANRLTRDYSVNAIRVALGDLVCAFPVYRTYITPRTLESEDRVLLAGVLDKAKAITALPDRSVHDFLGSVLLGTIPMGRPGRAQPGVVNRFRRRFQQLTGPVMAKSLEDTLFYRYARFLVLNEVGGEPSRFGISPADFHAENRERAKTWPQALTTTATHDTKRGEDARARLLALSESPDLWSQALAIWKAEVGAVAAPDANDQYMLFQAVLGVWPVELLADDDIAVLGALRKRLAAYVPKALREAKRHSKWIEPNEPYERATIELLDRLFANGSSFVVRIRPIVQDLARRGMLVSLYRTVLKCTVPGVPDFYQGTALWDFSLVDPDNRRPVDYVERSAILTEGERLADLFEGWTTGAVKLRLASDLLRDRRDHALFYAKADYTPLTVTGPLSARVIAFSRRYRDETLVVIVPRLSGSASATAVTPVGMSYWQGTTIDIPAGHWTDVFEANDVQSGGSIMAGTALAHLPFAVLRESWMSDKGKGKHKSHGKAGHDSKRDREAKPDRDGRKADMNVETSPMTMTESAAELGYGRVVIEAVTPELDGGRHPIKVVTGDTVTVEADVFTDGHEKIGCEVLWRPIDQNDWNRAPMTFLGNDRWTASFTPTRNIRHVYTVEGWRDPFASLLDGILKKRAAKQDLAIEAREAVALIAEADPRGGDRSRQKSLLDDLAAQTAGSDTQLDLIAGSETRSMMARFGPRQQTSRYDRDLDLVVDRTAAIYSSWYELFPRSITDDVKRHGTFRDVIRHLPYVRDLGFDVLYFPPINPIGLKNRKGKNNTLTPTETDVGSVYGIGSPDGGHDAIHPELGTIEDFRALVAAAKDHGLEIALDFAIQCSQDHPWIKEHPEWFVWRPDGTIQYAENPPKKYEDIVNVDFYGQSIPSLWTELRDAMLFWVREGVRILRVDNPHTKPIPFWRWVIAEINGKYPDVIFLAEAFTRPAMMKQLAKVGYQQSYTYFTWRNEKWEIEQYMAELAGPMGEYYRPNFFVNTPDINPGYLQTGGRAGHLVRATLAATLSSNWGVYSGFELCEARPLPGKEEYLDSEKYEIKVWDYDRPGHIKDYIRRLNAIRRENPALHAFRNWTRLTASNDNIIAYAKFNADKTNCILVLVNLDPFNRQECSYEIPLWEWGLPDTGSVEVEDLLGGYTFTLYGKTHQIALDPYERSAIIWRLAPPADWKGH